ncbi:hypothetical protein [Sorangium sp. So ce1389]|uniref:hypothetical protein n=1 Tax=Sorangium sp. So ce1389 TaxID=3133336 RepID=UPI003F622C24
MERSRPGDAESPLAPAGPYVGGIGTGVLPVDIAVSPDGLGAAILHAGSKSVLETPLVTLEQRDAFDTCSASADQRALDVSMSGDPIAVGYDAEGNLLVQLREPPGIARFAALNGKRVNLIEIPGESRLDDAHIFFHRSDARGLAPRRATPAREVQILPREQRADRAAPQSLRAARGVILCPFRAKAYRNPA